MTAAEARRREQIIQAAARLTGEGLIERTWGNISARLSETQFLITPSGLAYETMEPDQLVPVSIPDAAWTGPIKPSSERGIHADAYRLRPEVQFIIHTHQYYASVAGIEGRALTGFIDPLLGKRAPCAAYGLPGTARLRRAVEAELTAWPDCRALLLRSHGALCLGRDPEDAFAAARALEEVSRARVLDRLEENRPFPVPPDLGFSRRQGDAFLLTRRGRSRIYPLNGSSLPRAAALHAAVYRAGHFRYVAHETSSQVLAVSASGRRLRPDLDDLAQIAGADLLCVPAEPDRVHRAVRGRSAVLLWGMGALCAGESEDDVLTLRALLAKGCEARLYAGAVPGCRPLHPADAALQRLVYLRSYRKRGLC